jgi:hypothetical protein
LRSWEDFLKKIIIIAFNTNCREKKGGWKFLTGHDPPPPGKKILDQRLTIMTYEPSDAT